MKTYIDTMCDSTSFQLETKPHIFWNHIDGPVLVFSDGQSHWLSRWERFVCWVGAADAESLQRKLRPRLTKTLEAFWNYG